MRKPLVYLAGPIAGIPGESAYDWRLKAAYMLEDRGLETLNPLRAKEALVSPEVISTDYADYSDLGHFFAAKAIMTRDFTDVRRCDALLVNLLGAERPSFGTVMELAWAYAYQKPAVVAIEAAGNLHDRHPMLHEAMPFRVETLDEAIDAVAVILNR